MRRQQGTHTMTVKNTKLMDLPYDIIADIISRLPVKSIIGCKFVSKPLNDLISGPSFSQIDLTSKSSYFWTINLNLNASRPDCFLDLVEFDQKGNHENVQIFNTKRLPGRSSSSSSCKLFSICGYCNGLICLLKLEFGLHQPCVINPILSEFIQLPEEVDWVNKKGTHYSYGLGHCQLSNRYKVLRVTTLCLGDRNWKTNTEIFTIGYDQIWRSVSDVNLSYIMKSKRYDDAMMVPLRSALHWLLYPVSSSPNMNICAFDMTEETLSALQLPPESVAITPYFLRCLHVLLDKLCLSVFRGFLRFDFWVMDEYGVEGSWTKKLVLDMETLLHCTCSTLISLAVSPGGVILISGYHRYVIYDLKKEIYLRGIHWSNHYSYPIPFVPNFVSLRNLVQPSGLMTDVPPCSLGSQGASAPLNDQLQ